MVHQREHQAPPRVPDDGLLVAEAVERAREEARDVRAERLRLGRDREGRGAERAGHTFALLSFSALPTASDKRAASARSETRDRSRNA